MNIGILLCDEVPEKFSGAHGQYPSMFAQLLHKVEPALTFSVFNAEQQELPADVDAADAYLITGSRHGVNDGYPWIDQLEAFIRTLHERHKKVVGICFGHQLIAKALGGTVDRAATGWGIGITTNTLQQLKSWMQPAKDEFNLIISHQDQVIELPKGVEILASNARCPYFMMQIGQHMLTIQGHPEFSRAYSQALIEDRADLYGEAMSEQGLRSLQQPVDDELMAQWIIRFFNQAF